MNDPVLSRRAFLASAAALTAGAAVPSTLLADTTDSVEVARRTIRLPGLPAAFEGYRIAQVSDVHLYDGFHRAAAHTLTLLERLRPDLIVVTGDLWDTPAGAGAAAEWLQSLPRGVSSVAILGNHEYDHLVRGVRPEWAYERGGVPLLVNEVLTLRRGDAKLALIGLDDLRNGRPDPVGVVPHIPEGAVQCWLIHEPEVLEQMRFPASGDRRFSLSGHTHGGQVRIFGIPPLRPRGSGRFLAGDYVVQGGPAYVCRGIGTSGLRVRVDCPPELPVFTLTAAA